MTRISRSIPIAIAEDDADDRLLIQEAFEQCDLGNELMFAENGEELMALLSAQPAGDGGAVRRRYPGLILLDLNMPRMDGRETLRMLKGDPHLCRLPVVILTTSQADIDVTSSYGLGVNSFITKPSTFAKMVDTVSVIHRYWLESVALPTQCSGSPYDTDQVLGV